MGQAGEPDEPDEPDVSPWSAEDVPIRSAPLEIDWASRRPTADDPIEFASARTDRPVRDRDPVGPPTTAGQGRRTLIGIVVLVVAAAAILVATRSDEPGDSSDAESAAEPTTAPTVDDTEPAATTTVREPTTVRPAGGTATEVELPPAVAAIQVPTEIVMVSAEGLVQTLSLPSGRVSTVEVVGAEMGGFGAPIVVSPDASAFVTGPSDIVIVPRAGPPLSIPRDVLGIDANAGAFLDGWYRDADGGSVFGAVVYSEARPVRFAIDVQGRVTEVGPEPFVNAWFFGASPDGMRIVNDAGGAYEVAVDGTSRRIEDGLVLAATADHRLVRRCDETMTCALELVTVSTGGREALDRAMLPEDFEQLSGATLSPDGRAIALRRDGEESERVLVTLGSGETAVYPIVGWDQRAGWAADGSGVFDVVGGGDIGAGGGGGDDGAGQGAGDGAIRFTSLDGNSVVFGDELGRITALGVRWPEAEIEPERTVVTREITPASPIGPTGITLTAATRVGAMSIIDVDAGVARTWEMTDGVGRVPLTLLATGDGTVVLPDSDRRAFVTGPSDERSLSTAFDVTGLKLPGPAPDTVWVPSGGPEGDGVAYSLLPLAASSPDEALATVAIRDAELLGSDGRGGLVVARGGDVFVVDGAGTTRLTSGQLVAIRGEIAYVRECDDVAECALIRVNRATGQRDVVAGFAGPDSLPGATPVERGAALATSVAPGGEVVVALVDVVSVEGDDTGTTATTESATIEQEWALVDLTAGTITVVPGLDARQPVIWSPDAAYAVALADAQLQVYDRAAATLVSLDIDPVVAIGPAPPLDTSP